MKDYKQCILCDKYSRDCIQDGSITINGIDDPVYVCPKCNAAPPEPEFFSAEELIELIFRKDGKGLEYE